MKYAYQLPLEAKQKIQQAKSQGKTVVFATGVFDLLHREHIKFLEKAKQAGDILVVGIETDARVRVLKSAGRPISREQNRVSQLKQTAIPDAVFLLPEKFSDESQHRAVLKMVNPDILAVSSHTPYLQQKRKLMEEIGGSLKVVHQHNPEISTTKIINNRQEKEE